MTNSDDVVSKVLWEIYWEAKKSVSGDSETNVSSATLSLIHAFERDLYDHQSKKCAEKLDTASCAITEDFRCKDQRRH